MKHLPLFLLFATLWVNVTANPIDEDKARAIALDFLVSCDDGYVNGRTSREVRLERCPLKTLSENCDKTSSDALIYIFNLSDNQGYIIVSGDDNCRPVLAYSFEGGFQEPEQGSVGDYILGTIRSNVAKTALKSKSNTHGSIATGQRTMFNGIIPRRSDLPERVDPMLPNIWDQQDPFNRHCPLIDSVRCVTGCVATALAQVMHYHRWPEVGTGSFTYLDRIGCNQELTADFSSHH